ncbi:hypothetical protein AMK59_7735 [Oryctes borbonicus]|uniref:C2H2-type domain-containing protein n=1 Tax=Oryctes borbonicus TaxID=1629725 RepID=A0A0T6AWE1_9SCAR|nr:hypothetical protein AMK59_7735 [Oryctes borbonicus]
MIRNGGPPKLEKMVMTPTKVAKKKILRKKKHRWASGLLRKKNKPKNSTSDEKDDTEPILRTIKTEKTKNELHCKDYYVDGPKNQCKLCSFRGKLVIQHYKSGHPKSEVLISRMDPKTTEHLIREARDKRYDLIEIKEKLGTKKLRYGFKCPFKCLIGTTVDTFENYYDHITCHTGEHRYFCPYCNFSTFNPRNLRAHMVPQHNSNLEHHGKPATPAPPSSKYMFGFVCKECHYVQTKREKIESHVRDYHDNDAEIIKINLSLICQEQNDTGFSLESCGDNNLVLQSQKKQEHISECIENVVNGAGSIRSPEPSMVKDLNIFELMSQIEAEEPPPVLVKVEPLELEPDLDALVPEIHMEEPQIEKPKDPDLTVFMCRSDLPPVDDEETIEQRRLKKMNEIHENFKPSRTSIVDKLQRMLETAKENDSTIPTAPVPVSSPAFSKPPLLIPLEKPKKSLDTIAKNLLTTEVSLAPKNVAPISSIINRLQDKLLPTPGTSTKGIGGNDSAPSSATSSPTRESISSTDQSFCNLIPTLTIGPISICFDRNKEVLYSCLVPHCVFNTISSHLFENHCKMKHQDFIYNQTKCNLCNIKIDREDTCVSMHDIYKHICTCHKDFFESEATIPIFTEDSQETISLPENFEEILNTEQNENQTGTLYPFKIADAAILKDGSNQNVEPEGENDTKKQYSFVITSVTSVEQPVPPKEENKKKNAGFSLPHRVPNVISQASHGSGPKFPFIITNVTSLAKKPLPNKQQFITTTPTSIVPKPISQIVVTSSPAALNATRTEAVSTNTLLPIPPLIAVQSVSGIQTSPAIKTYTIPSTATTSAIVPIILNPLAPENERTQLQLPVISSIQSLAPVRKDIIRPVPLNQLTSNIAASAEKVELPEVPQDVIALVANEGTTVTINDIPLTKKERLVLRKNTAALMNMLSPDVAYRFYKCPIPSCSFTSDKAPGFAKHLGTHTAHVGSMYVPCLHCDFKMPFKMYMVHLEVRHNKCEYGCGKCLYRATNPDFINAHNRMKHNGEPVVVKTPRENMPARIPGGKLISIKSVLKPYICTRFGCNVETIFSDVFFRHVATQHSKTPPEHCFKPNSVSVPGVYLYHCRYCVMGSNKFETVVNHQASVHSRMDYCIIHRKFVPDPNFPERTGLSYSLTDDSIYDRLHFIYGDNNVATPSIVAKSTANGPNSTEYLFLTSQHNEDSNNVFVDMDQSQNDEGAVESAFDPLLNDVNMVDCSEVTSGDEPEIPIFNNDLDEGTVDPLSFDNNREEPVENIFSDGFDSNDEKTGENETTSSYDPKAMKYTEEYSGVDLFKCVCGSGFEDRFKFKQHVTVCQANKTLICAHCGVVRKTVRNLLTHLNEHGRKRFKCSLCQFKHSSKRFVKDHMNLKHNVLEMMILPAKMSRKVDYHKDDFVLRPKLSPVKRIANLGPTSDTHSSIRNKILFSPDEIKYLPRPPIYVSDVFCAICNYATKVKSNMVRHLQAHQNEQAVPQTAPVNPVPCLEKSEKMFDKMVNLALSSHSGGRMGGASAKAEKIDENDVPTFVAINKRFVCGAQSCTYLCPEESMLRRHLMTFHSLDLNYTCLHCNSKLFEDKVINVDTILKHLKLHDNHLYACGNCKFIHNLKHKVERHLSDKHPEKSSALIVIRELGKEIDTEGVVPAEKEEPKKPWRCGMCKFRCAGIEEVKNHTLVKHNVSAKQKCALCEFGIEEMTSLLKHFEIDHNGQPIDIIVSYYKEDEVQQKPDTDSEFNTTPLWQRNKSIKHIRGILLDDTNNKTPKTIGPKKAKASKAKKQENEAAKTTKPDPLQDAILNTEGITKKTISAVKKDVATESGKRPIALTFDTPKGVDVRKPAPKRRKSKVENKIASLPQEGEAKPKTNEIGSDNDVIVVNNSDEDNGEVIDIINVDEIRKTKKNEPSKPKHNITVLSDHRLNANVENDKPNEADETHSGLKSKIILISRGSTDVDDPETLEKPPCMTLMPKIVDVMSLSSEVIEIADERPEVVQILDDTLITTENGDIPSPEGKDDVMEINDDKVIDFRPRSSEDAMATIIKINSPAPVLNEYSQITLEDSSTEDSDVIEVVPSNDVGCNETPIDEIPKEHEVTNIPNSEIVVDEPTDGVENPEAHGLKNVKLVNVCSIRDTYNRDAEESSECGESENCEVVESVENLQNVEEEIPAKKSKLDLTVNDIEAMTKSELLNGNFVGTYGPYGFPWSGKYKCPLCEKYLSVSKVEFVAHIYEELQYGMYKCSACGFTDSVKTTVKDHHKLSHKDIQTEERVILNLDLQIVDWVDKLTAFQTRILTLDKEDMQETHFYCYFCEYRCAAQSDMRKHQVRHWTSTPYTCAVCNYKGIQRSVVVRHIARSHPKASVVVNELDIGDEVLIKRVRMTWRSDKHQESPKSFETLETEGDADFNLEDLKDAFLNCSYCPYKEKLDSLKKHCAEKHPNLKLKAFRYRCNYCASTFLAHRSVEQHFKQCHAGMRHSYSTACGAQRAFTCTECSVSEDKLLTMEEHLRSHFKMIKCLYCGLRTVYWKTMKRHHNEKHRGETYEFAYLISEEKKYEEALTKVKQTNNRTVISSKKRKRPEDDILLLEDDLNVPSQQNSSKDKVRQVARKSTGTRMVIKESESHYGKVPSTEDFANILTTVDVMGVPVTMNIIKLSKILNISPSVVLEDCESAL